MINTPAFSISFFENLFGAFTIAMVNTSFHTFVNSALPATMPCCQEKCENQSYFDFFPSETET
jgi:hypothetical protein